MTALASARGRANRAKGHRAERAVAAYLREHGYPEASTTRHRLGRDGFHAPGDVIGVPALVVEVKDVQSRSAWPTWVAQAQQEANGTPWVVIRKLPGTTDVGRWPCVASLSALGQRAHAVPLSLQQAMRRLDGLPNGYWLACERETPMLAVGRFGWLIREDDNA